MICLRGHRLQIMADTGRVMLAFALPATDYDNLLSMCRTDFKNVGMPHVFGVSRGGTDAQSRLSEEMEDRKLKFEHWSSIGVSGHAFFGFSQLHDMMFARLLI